MQHKCALYKPIILVGYTVPNICTKMGTGTKITAISGALGGVLEGASGHRASASL